jgi:hypothetical protein
MSYNSEQDSIGDKNEDLINAMNGQISYATTNYENKSKVSLSYPIESNSNSILTR